MLHQIIYVSTPDQKLKISEVETIVKRAREKNEARSISGFLVANSDFFIQCLEGEKTEIEKLYEVIAKDPRHSNVKLLHSGECSARNFERWGMGVVLKMERHFDVLSRYSKRDEFDPYSLSAKESLDMLIDFSNVRGI